MTSLGRPGYGQHDAKSPVHDASHGQVLQPTPGRESRQLPSLQICTTSQRSPQPPQCCGSLLVSTHEPPQRSSPPPQSATQLPPLHTGVPPLQTRPSIPQFIGSVAKSRQVPPTSVRPGRQTQPPATQYSRSPQALPAPPQFSGSRVMSTQRPPLDTSGGAQVQTPEVHVPPPQPRPHSPQLASSLERSAQVSPQATSPAPQTHAPAAQSEPLGQLLPQAPQLSGSLRRPVVQPLPQSIVPAGQAQSPLVQTAPGSQSLPQPPQ